VAYINSECEQEQKLTKDYFELMSRALTHYAKRFEELKENEEITKLGNTLVVRDLEDNTKKALEIAEELVRLRSNNTMSDNQKIITSAMDAYLADLGKSKKALEDILSKNNMTFYTLRNINDEIRALEEYFHK
jgi:hypothetical protein